VLKHFPIYVCVPEEEVAAVIDSCPEEKREDLVFMSSGCLEPLLKRERERERKKKSERERKRGGREDGTQGVRTIFTIFPIQTCGNTTCANL